MSDEFREQFRADVLVAFGLDRPPSRLDRWRSWLPAQRLVRRRWLAMERAQTAARVREAEFAAALPGRMDKAAAGMNERLADVLPPGMRFEWTTEDRP